MTYREKREIGLTYIYGIGRSAASKIIAATGVNPDTRVKDLTEDEIGKLREAIDAGYTVEGDLRRQVALDIKRLMEIGCYRGIRHRKRASRSRTENEDKRENEKGPGKDNREQEEVIKEESAKWLKQLQKDHAYKA